MNYDALVIGGGPAGLAAGAALARAGTRVLLLDKEAFGGTIVNVEWIHGYPQAGAKIEGPKLSSALVEEARAAGVELEIGEVTELAAWSGCLSATCADGRAYTASSVILAGGLASKALGVPGEERLQGKGMIHCAMCDAGFYRDKAVAVCGAGRAGLVEALYFARFASRVIVIEAAAQPSASAALLERARAEAKLEIRCGEKPVEVVGDDGVTGLVVERAADGRRERLEAQGVLVHVGYQPATQYLEGVVALDASGAVAVNDRLETGVAGAFAAGDIRAGSRRDVASAVADGKAAAAAALRALATVAQAG